MERRVWAGVWTVFLLATSPAAFAQLPAPQGPKQGEMTAAEELPLANPARPTISTPATLTPVGYVQSEGGFQQSWDSPEFGTQTSVNEVLKLAVSRRFEFIALSGPYAHSDESLPPVNGTGDASVGLQAVAYQGRGAWPTVALSYFGRVYSGDAPDVDFGSAKNTGIVLFSADLGGFHVDTDYLFNEQVELSDHRVQYGQTLSIAHPLVGKFGLSGELWHFTQPFLHSDCGGSLWALNYNARRNLVLDGGFNRGLTGSSTQWEVFAGFTYVLPHRVQLW